MKKKRDLIKKLNDLVRKAGVPRYLHHLGPKKYTTWMHLKCVFLKEKLKDYSWRTLVEEHLPYYFPGIDLPHFTTLQKFSKRMPSWLWNQITRWSAQVDEVDVAAIDGTGFSRTKASSYYVKRIDRDTPLQRHVQAVIYTDCRRKKILALKINAKPAGETKAVAYLTRNSPAIAETNIMDKGFDSQQVHEHFRQKGVYSIIPARKGCKRGRYRKEMRDYFDHTQYWQRNMAETINSSIKRKYSSTLSSTNIRNQRSQIYSRAILHNITSLFIRHFLQSLPEPNNTIIPSLPTVHPSG